MKPYPSYIDSEVEWIGKIPSSWTVIRNKYITTPRKDKSQDGSEELLSVSEYLGVVPRGVIREGEDHLSRSESLEGYLKVSKGNLVNNIMLMWKKGLGVSKYDGIVSPSYSVFSFNVSNPTYHHYLYRTDLYITEFRKNSTGIIQSRLRLYDDDFGNIYSYLPPLSEQNQIVSFLDHKTQKIDKLIEKTEHKIELLKEKRTSLINHCVTKGLNSGVEMRDSGVEWIGEIPSHWISSKLKYHGKFFSGYSFDSGDFDDEGEVRVIKISNIQNNGISWDDLSFLPREYYDKYDGFRVIRGDLVFVLTRPIISTGIKVCFYDEEYLTLLNQRNSVYRSDEESLVKRFLYYLVRSFYFVEEFKQQLKETNQPNISTEQISSIKVNLPPSLEQLQIVEYLDEQTQKIDTTIEKETKRIELLKEYRQSLISDVVTGKIDVRDWNG